LRFPTAKAIRTLDLDTFSREAWDLIGRKVAKRRWLAETHAMAAESIGLPVALGSTAIDMFRLQLSRYLELNNQREQLDVRAQQMLSDNADFHRLQSLPGIGAVMALTILAEAAHLRRFAHHRQFLKYCGLDLSKTQSG
jgi:transposase